MKMRIRFTGLQSTLFLCLATFIAGAAAQVLPPRTGGTQAPRRPNRQPLPAGTLPLANPVQSWMSQNVASSTNPLVYVSFITGQNSGGTNIYEITSVGGKQQAQLIGTLDQGGGIFGSVAVDAQQNVYIIEADLDDNGFQIDCPVYKYARGSAQGTLIFTAQNLNPIDMIVARDGSVYIAGMDPATGTIFSVTKFSPPGYSPQVLFSATNPKFPTGISVDAAGNVFVGWFDSSDIVDPCRSGCITELPAGQSQWQIRLRDFAANNIESGPIATTAGSLIFWTGFPGAVNFLYMETVPSGAQYPSSVTQFSVLKFAQTFGGNAPILAMGAGGNELWASSVGLFGFLGAPTANVLGISYPKGNVVLKIPVDSPLVPAFMTGMAVSPAYFP